MEKPTFDKLNYIFICTPNPKHKVKVRSNFNNVLNLFQIQAILVCNTADMDLLKMFSV